MWLLYFHISVISSAALLWINKFIFLNGERNIWSHIFPPHLWEHPKGQLSCLFTAHQCQIKNTPHSYKRVFVVYQVIFDLYHCGHIPALTNYFHLPTTPTYCPTGDNTLNTWPLNLTVFVLHIVIFQEKAWLSLFLPPV